MVQVILHLTSKCALVALISAFVIIGLSSARPASATSNNDNKVPEISSACENVTIIKRSVSLSKDNLIDVVTTPAAAKDCPVTVKVIYRWGQWYHPLFPQITKDPDISVRFGTTTGGYFPRQQLTCGSNRVCSVSYSGIPEIVKKEPVYYLVRLEYSFFRMVINYLPFMGTDTIECDVEISYNPCVDTPYLTLEPVDGNGVSGIPVVFTAILHNWDFADKTRPEIVYEWYVEGIKKYESREQVPESRVTHTFETAGDKTVRVHITPANAQGDGRTLKPLFKEQVTFKIKQQ